MLPACDLNEPDPEPVLRVNVFDRESMMPEAGVKLVLMDLSSNTPVAGPILSDDIGYAEFMSPGPGHYQILAFPGYGRGVFKLPDPIGSADKTSPPPVHELLTWRRPAFNDVLPRYSGVVRDAVTGALLDGVFIGPGGFADMYTGAYTVQSDVSGPQGAFHVADITVIVDLFSGNIIQAAPLMVQCAGYRPIAWRNHFSNGDNNVDVTGIVIELEPIGDVVTGDLRGRVLFRDAPLAGVSVALSWFDDPMVLPGETAPADKAGVGLPGHVAVTDSLGWYGFTGLAPGSYLVHPAFLKDDGYMQPEWVVKPVRVEADSTVTQADLSVLAEIRPLYPMPGTSLSSSPTELRWYTAAEVDTFGVYLGRCALGLTTEMQLDVPQDCQTNEGYWGWLVEGFFEGKRVALFEGDAWFEVRGEATSDEERDVEVPAGGE